MPYRDIGCGAIKRIVRFVTKDDLDELSYSPTLDEPSSRSGQLLSQQFARGEGILLAKFWDTVDGVIGSYSTRE